jgi:HK97 family phage prohead protease
MERRFNSKATFRTDPGGGIGPTIEGYAARYNVISHDLGGFRERIAPGAFRNSLRAGGDVKCLVNHSADRILGRLKNKTLSLAEDDNGLHFRCLLPDTSDGRDIATLLARGDLSDCSFAFSVDDGGDVWTDEDRHHLDLEDEDDEDDDEDRSIKVRTLRSVKLHDVSIVTSPAYPRTSVGLNSVNPAMIARSQADYFPTGIPQEVRNHISLAVNPQVQESRRRRLTNLFIS